MSQLTQLDTSTWISQLFWLMIMFSLMYVLINTVVLKRISSIFELREQKISGDLKRAKELQKRAQEVFQDGEEIVSRAKEDSREILQDTISKAQKQADKLFIEKQASIENFVKQSLSNTEKIKNKNLSSVDEVAQSLIFDVFKSVIHDDISKEKLKKTIELIK